MCVGSHLANRELYTAFIRLISAFYITTPKDPRDEPIIDALDANAVPTSLAMEPKPFKCGFKIRDEGRLRGWTKGSDERTKGMF